MLLVWHTLFIELQKKFARNILTILRYAITSLETQDLPLAQTFGVLDSVQQQLESISDPFFTPDCTAASWAYCAQPPILLTPPIPVAGSRVQACTASLPAGCCNLLDKRNAKRLYFRKAPVEMTKLDLYEELTKYIKPETMLNIFVQRGVGYLLFTNGSVAFDSYVELRSKKNIRRFFRI
ncbi:hypothetical protein NQ318_016267 [Aromia moschata]|uniref:Uncharacterized protein n=1 Tax=Aromia moschata TaxID=1265417 RepID=A0AAV8Y2C7_9CUCU|nr:hypothetical protein NQ318_016267 [Aromia moschata]